MLKDKIMKMLEFLLETEEYSKLSYDEQEEFNKLLKHKANLHRNYDMINDERTEELLWQEIKLVDAKIDHIRRLA